MNHTKKDDLLGTVEGPLKIDISPYLGTWKNANPVTGLVGKVVMTEQEGILYMHAYGVGATGLIDWGQSPCIIFTDAVNSPIVNALRTEFEFDSMKVQMVSNVKHGTLVLQFYTTFKDGSPRFNYYNREFFAPVED